MLLIPAFQAAQIIYIRSNTQDSPYTALKVPKCEILMSWILMIFL